VRLGSFYRQASENAKAAHLNFLKIKRADRAIVSMPGPTKLFCYYLVEPV
jgi:hypothetical protein